MRLILLASHESSVRKQAAIGRLVLLFVFLFSCLCFQSIRVSGDGLSYYAYLRSVLFDGDFDFTNEFGDHNPQHHATPDPAFKTATGLVANPYSIGPALLWAPFVLPIHVVQLAATSNSGATDLSRLTGYELSYIAGIVLGTNFFALLGLLAMFEVSSRYFGYLPGLLACLAVWLGTAYVNYLYFEPTYSHVISAAFVALYLWSYDVFQKLKKWQWVVGCGIASGLMILTRWQNVVFLIIPAVDLLFDLFMSRRFNQTQIGKKIVQLLVITGITGVLFLPQVAVWRQIYGEWLLIPMGGNSLQWMTPALDEILFSPRNGLFSWTPITLLGFIGVITIYRVNKRLAAGLLIALLAQWYINSSVADWWGGSAYGSRRFIDSSVVFVLGLASLAQLAWRNRILRSAVFIVVMAAIVWNLLLWTQYAIGTPPIQSLNSIMRIYLGQFLYGLPNVYRLLGRSTWLDLTISSGILRQNWIHVLTALAWLASLITVVLIVGFIWSGLSRASTDGRGVVLE